MAWGLGDNRYALPVFAPKTIAGDVASIATGGLNSFFIKSDHTLWAMGYNTNGQLGNGTTSLAATTVPVKVATDVVSVAAGLQHTMFIRTDGSLWGMGSNGAGQLGDGTTTDRSIPAPVASGVTAVAVGSQHTLFLKTDGSLWAMGFNGNGELGTGNNDQQTSPIQIATGVTGIAADVWGGTSYFIKSDATLWGMGYNGNGGLGDGTGMSQSTPVQIATNVKTVSAHIWRAMFIKLDGTLWGTGYNSSGQLGDSSTSDSFTPVQVATNVTSVAVGGTHTLFFKTDGTLWAMGANNAGQLCNGLASALFQLTPVQVATGVTAAATGGSHSLLLMPDRTLRAVGDNLYGQLGDGQPLPGPELIADGVTAASADSPTNNLFIKSDGTLWQHQVTGQISQVPGVTGVVQVIAGSYGQQRLYLKTDRTLWKLALDGTSSQVASGVQSAGAGYPYFAYLKTDGTLWGQGGDANLIQFGDGTAPVQMADHVTSFSASAWHILYVKQDQSLWGYGSPWGTFFPDFIWGQTVSSSVQLETGIAAAIANPNQNLYFTPDHTLWTRGNGWSTYAGPAVPVDSDVTAAASGVSGSLYLKTDGILRFRAGVQGGLGPVTSIASSILSVSSGPDGWALYLQTKGFGTTPTISAAPQSMTTVAGTPITLNVTAAGSGPLAYQWSKDGSPLSWAHSDQLVIPYLTAADTGAYTVVVTNSAGSVTSSAALIQLPAPPAITSGLTADTTVGQPFSYVIAASHQPDDFDALNLPAGLAINHHTGEIAGTPTAAGVFQVTISASNAAGSSIKALRLTVARAKATVALGNLLQFSDGTPKAVTVTTSPTGLSAKVTYNGNLAAPTAVGLYLVKAEITDPNYQGSASGLLLVSLPPFVIAGQPVNTTVIAGHNAKFTVTAVGLGTLSYQWRKGNTALAGATGASLSIPNAKASDAGNYSVVVSNKLASVTSSVATLSVITPVTLTAQPQSVTRSAGQSATFSVTAAGTAPLTYQWFKGPTLLTGATQSSFTVTNVHAANAGNYRVVVTNPAGAVASTNATLTIH